MTRTRSRNLFSGVFHYGTYTDAVGNKEELYLPTGLTAGSELCVDSLHKGPPYLKGGPLSLERWRRIQEPSGSVSLDGALARHYSGVFLPGVGFSGIAPLSYTTKLSDNQMVALGTKGWNRYRPGKPKTSGGQFVGELRDLPRVGLQKHLVDRVRNIRRRLNFFRSIGEEYLNLTFGWLPFLNDVHSIINTQKELNKHLKQLRRDNGKDIHRKGTISHDGGGSSTTTTTGGPPLLPVLTSEFYYQLRGQTILTTEWEESTWFSGTFRYWIPDIDSDQWTDELTRRLADYNLSPSLAWELMPWSWMIDWFTSAGDVIANTTTGLADHLVASHAFVMRHRKESYRLECRARIGPSGSWTSAVNKLERETKQRMAASPIGFGLTPADLSGAQGLTLGALGLSRFF